MGRVVRWVTGGGRLTSGKVPLEKTLEITSVSARMET